MDIQNTREVRLSEMLERVSRRAREGENIDTTLALSSANSLNLSMRHLGARHTKVSCQVMMMTFSQGGLLPGYRVESVANIVFYFPHDRTVHLVEHTKAPNDGYRLQDPPGISAKRFNGVSIE